MNSNFKIGKVYESEDQSLEFKLIKLTKTPFGFDFGTVKVEKDLQNYVKGSLSPISSYQSEIYEGMYEVPLDYLSFLISNFIECTLID